MPAKLSVLQVLPMIALAIMPALVLVVANDARTRRAVAAVQRERAAVEAELFRARAENTTLIETLHTLKERQRHVTLIIGNPTVVGALDRDAVERVARERSADVVGCYDDALATSPSTAGWIAVNWVVNNDGTMRYVTLDGMSNSAASIFNCLTRRTSQWRFPQAKRSGTTTIC